MGACTECGDGFGPEVFRFRVRALVVTGLDRRVGAKQSFVRNHRVVPRGQPCAESCSVLDAESGAENLVHVHITPTLSSHATREGPAVAGLADTCIKMIERPFSVERDGPP